jgi:hypothetical protein
VADLGTDQELIKSFGAAPATVAGRGRDVRLNGALRRAATGESPPYVPDNQT